MYKISIILPTFNVDKYLKKSFDSLLSQTIGFSNLQVIFVDDFSTDNSREVMDNYAKQYENVISVHLNQNSGAAGKPRNEGIKYAFADYIMFLDPDDYLMEDACEVLYNKITESNVDIVIGGYLKGDWRATWKSILNTKESLIEHPLNDISLFFNPPGLSAKIIKRELIIKNNIRFPERIPAQDLVFLTECYLNAKSILTLNDFIVYCYYVRDEENNKSITNNITERYLLNLLTAYNLTLELLLKFNVDTNLIKLYFSRSHISFFTNQLKRSDFNSNDLGNFFNSDVFLKFRNQDYILNDEELNNFFNDLTNDYTAVETSSLTKIWKNAKIQFENSPAFVPETIYHSDGVFLEEEMSLMEIEYELHNFLKKTSKLNNKLGDYKKTI